MTRIDSGIAQAAGRLWSDVADRLIDEDGKARDLPHDTMRMLQESLGAFLSCLAEDVHGARTTDALAVAVAASLSGLAECLQADLQHGADACTRSPLDLATHRYAERLIP